MCFQCKTWDWVSRLLVQYLSLWMLIAKVTSCSQVELTEEGFPQLAENWFKNWKMLNLSLQALLFAILDCPMPVEWIFKGCCHQPFFRCHFIYSEVWAFLLLLLWPSSELLLHALEGLIWEDTALSSSCQQRIVACWTRRMWFLGGICWGDDSFRTGEVL